MSSLSILPENYYYYYYSIPNRPGSKITADLLEFKEEQYLVLVDYYSDWIEFDKMRHQTATETIALLLK